MKRTHIELDAEKLAEEYHYSPLAKTWSFDVGSSEVHKVEVTLGRFSYFKGREVKVLVDGKSQLGVRAPETEDMAPRSSDKSNISRNSERTSRPDYYVQGGSWLSMGNRNSFTATNITQAEDFRRATEDYPEPSE